MNELKPCPFCGGEPMIIKAEQQNSRLPVVMYEVACNNPDCLMNIGTGMREEYEECFDAWNTRTQI